MKSTPELPSAILKTPAKGRERETKKDNAESPEDTTLQQIDDLIDRCRELYQHPLISDKTRREYDEDWERLRRDKKLDWMQGNVSFLQQTINKVESYTDRFGADLQRAVDNEWISRESQERWWNRFHDPNTPEYTRDQWLKQQFPELLKNWQALAEKRTDVENLAKGRKLTAKQIPELALIADKKALLALSYQDRKDRIEKTMALVKAYDLNRMAFMRTVENDLKNAAKAGWMHRAKIGAWMERVITSDDPEAFASTILFPFIQNWQAARADFDKLNRALDRQGIPRGFRPVHTNDFLLMEYKQRTSYCALAWIRLEDAAESDKAVASAKLRIRHNLDTEDWEEAEKDLSAALKEWPQDREFRSMKTYLECHRAEEDEDAAEKKESPDPAALLQNIRTMLSSIEGELHMMYVEAALAGPKVFNRFLQLSYNRVWVHENGYSDPAREIRNARDEFNQEMTKQYMEQGHSEEIEHNIVDGETAAEEAIRYESRKPQMLYVGTLGRHAVMAAVKDNADNEDFGYSTSLVPTGTAYDVQARIVKNFHYPLKTAMRQLDDMGYRFTIAGSLERKGTERGHELN